MWIHSGGDSCCLIVWPHFQWWQLWLLLAFPCKPKCSPVLSQYHELINGMKSNTYHLRAISISISWANKWDGVKYISWAILFLLNVSNLTSETRIVGRQEKNKTVGVSQFGTEFWFWWGFCSLPWNPWCQRQMCFMFNIPLPGTRKLVGEGGKAVQVADLV